MASSTPGMANAISCSCPPMIPFGFWSIISWIEPVGSISMANKLEKPVTRVGDLLNFWPNASLRLWAGSVEILIKWRFWNSINIQRDFKEAQIWEGIPSIHLHSLQSPAPLFSIQLYNNTLSRTFDNWTAREQEFVVLPTPPLPPTKIHFREVWSRTFCSDGSNTSSSMYSILKVDTNKKLLVAIKYLFFNNKISLALNICFLNSLSAVVTCESQLVDHVHVRTVPDLKTIRSCRTRRIREINAASRTHYECSWFIWGDPPS